MLACPRCAGVVTLELNVPPGYVDAPASAIPGHLPAAVAASYPEDRASRARVDHLPEDVDRYYSDAQRVIDAGVPDAAAVQLRKTLEAAASKKGVAATKATLVQNIQRLIDDGFVTKDFGPVLQHVRKVGNMGAHHTDEQLSEAEVQRALRFTTQVLRNLFEVPGELAELEAEAAADPDADTGTNRETDSDAGPDADPYATAPMI